MINWDVMIQRLAKKASEYMEGTPVGAGNENQWRHDHLLDQEWTTEDDLWYFSLLPLIKAAEDRAEGPLSAPDFRLIEDVIADAVTPHFRIAVHNEPGRGIMLGIETRYRGK